MRPALGASAKRDPWCGVFSVAAPFIGLFVFPLASIAGIGLAIAAWRRHEKQWLLPWIGLLLNLALLIWFCSQDFYIRR